MAYVINTSTSAAVTLNLAQGRVQLAPRSYCTLHSVDLERARRIYNSKDLNLYVAETDAELELILGPIDEEKQEDPGTETSPIDEDPVDIGPSEPKDPDVDTESEAQDDNDTLVTSAPAQLGGQSEEEPDKAVIKQQLLDSIEVLRTQNDIDPLKELATHFGIQFMPNIGIDKLAARIVDFVQKSY